MLELGTQTIVEGTLWALEAASVVTWALILIKGFQHFNIGFYNKRFFQDFWRAPYLQAASELENE